ncbi:hypothetical protein A2U01_0097734, partial [Trifolium medium]|nr:hypothetical protein [Trifolium medium]
MYRRASVLRLNRGAGKG